MKLYVEMDEIQFEQYKESIKKPKAIKDFPSNELASALFSAIQREGGVTDSTQQYDARKNVFNDTIVAKITKPEVSISLVVQQLGNGR